MESFSVWHWFILVVYIGIIIIPCWRIVKKAGYSGALSLTILLPLVNLVLLWVFAFKKWPIEKH